MEEILKFGEFSSLLNKSHSTNSTVKENPVKNEDERKEEDQNEDDSSLRDKDNRGCQVENGQDIV